MSGEAVQCDVDCTIVGAGPAGLTAAIYLARFHLAIQIVDAGRSRTAMIPLTRNHAGYPGGISGSDLLARMREQAREFGAEVTQGTVDRLALDGDGFAVEMGLEAWRSKTVLLATGVVNNRPSMAADDHDAAVARGLLRYCPICDGYEVTDHRVAVLGTQTHGFNEAVFLRMYTPQVTLIAPEAAHSLSSGERARLADLGIGVLDGPCEPLAIESDALVVTTPQGRQEFDSVYPALGSQIRSELAVALGAKATADGCLEVDDHQRTTIAGLYAAGDVAKGLDQISHAMGEAGVAATTIRNDLASLRPLTR